MHSLYNTYLQCILNSCNFQISALLKRLYLFKLEFGFLSAANENASFIENIIFTAFLMLGVEIFDKEGEFFYEDLFNQDSRLNRNKIKQEIKAIALDAHERGLLNNQIDIHQDTDTFAANAVINLIEEYAFLYLVES